MSVEQLESAIQSLSIDERRALLDWVDDHRHQLLQDDQIAVEEAWKQETRRRIAQIEGGLVQGIPGEEVSANIRRIVGR